MHVLSSRILLRPADFGVSIDFYERKLGLSRYREWGQEPHRGVVFFLGGGFLELSESGDGQVPAGMRLWLQVDDIHAACRELTRNGVTLGSEPQRKPWGLLEVSIADPDGLELVIVEIPDDHPLRRRD